MEIRSFLLNIFPTDTSPRTYSHTRTIFLPFVHAVGHFTLHHHRPPVYNIKRLLTCTKLIEVDRLGSAVWVNASYQEIPHLMGRLESRHRVVCCLGHECGLVLIIKKNSRLVDRLGSGVRFSSSFQIFVWIAGRERNVLGGQGNCPGWELSAEYVWGGKCAGGGTVRTLNWRDHSLRELNDPFAPNIEWRMRSSRLK